MTEYFKSGELTKRVITSLSLLALAFTWIGCTPKIDPTPHQPAATATPFILHTNPNVFKDPMNFDPETNMGGRTSNQERVPDISDPGYQDWLLRQELKRPIYIAPNDPISK